MLMLSSHPVNCIFQKALYLIHPKDQKDPFVNQVLQLMGAKIKQIVLVGQHILSDSRFGEFPVVVSVVSYQNQKDYLQRLQAGKWDARLYMVSHDPRKLLVMPGPVVQLVGPKVLCVPKDKPVISNAVFQSTSVDIQTKGLNLLSYRFDIDFRPGKMSEFYLRILRAISNQESLYLLDPGVSYTVGKEIKFGSIYQMRRGVITQITKLPEDLTKRDQEVVQERKVIPPIKAIYEEDQLTEEEKKDQQAGQAETSGKQINVR